MPDITTFTKEQIEQQIEDTRDLIRAIDALIIQLGKFLEYVLEQGSVAGLDTHLQKMQNTITEGKNLLQKQTAAYESLSIKLQSNNSADIKEARTLLNQIKQIQDEIRYKKATLDEQAIILKSMIILFENQKKIPQEIEQVIENVTAELAMLTK